MFDPLSFAALAALAPPVTPMVYVLPAAQAQDDAQALEAVEKIIDTYNEAQQAFYEKLNAAESDEAQQKIYTEEMPDVSGPAKKLHEIANKHPKTEAAAKAATWVAMNAGSEDDDGAWAMKMLLTDFIDSEYIESVPQMCSALSSRNIDALEQIRSTTTNERAKALADFYRAGQLVLAGQAAKEFAEPGSTGDPYISFYLDAVDEPLKEKLKAKGEGAYNAEAGEKLYEHCVEAYGDVELYPESKVTVAAKADGALFELRNLQIGDVAPNIEGEDAEGLAFQLYDYKGQVVLLDFWGFW